MPRVFKPNTTAQAAPRRGIVLPFLYALAAWLYAYIGRSFVSRICCVYGALQRSYERSGTRALLHGRRKRHEQLRFRLRMALAARIEHSLLYRTLARIRRALLRCSVNSYGVFSFFFGCFTVVAYLLGRYFESEVSFLHLATGVFMIVLSLPLLLSTRAIGSALADSLFFRYLLVDICGIPLEKLYCTRVREGTDAASGEEHRFLSLVLAVVLGTLCALTALPPYVVPAAALLLLLLQLVFLYPEIGLLLVALFTPLLTLIPSLRPTAVLLGIVCTTLVSFVFKLIGGKRVLHPELLDSSVLLLGLLYLAGGLITGGGRASLQSALVYVAFLLCYFLAVSLLRTQAWINRLMGAMCVSCVTVACLGVLQYLLARPEVQYLDLSLFSDLDGRVYATLENPNMLAEYLVLLLPLLLAFLFRQKRMLRGFWMLLAVCTAVGCLILTWSRGAWLSAVIAVLFFLLLMGHRCFAWLLLSALPATALLHTLPERIVRRFLSIGSMTDSSIRYRVHLWTGVGDMLRDHWLCGVGVGEAAFCTAYARYALPGIGTAMHAHNLYMQLLCELGVVGLAAFGVTMLLFICCALSYVTGKGERSGRLPVLGCLCGILALLMMGVTDHIFYNYRIFLTFWLLMGVAVAQIRVSNAEASRGIPPHMVVSADTVGKRRF